MELRIPTEAEILREAERREKALEMALKPDYFPKWLEEAGVIAFLDFLLADRASMVTGGNPRGDYALHTVHALRRARALRNQLLSSAEDQGTPA
jgi:hypothetical protein